MVSPELRCPRNSTHRNLAETRWELGMVSPELRVPGTTRRELGAAVVDTDPQPDAAGDRP